MAFITEQAGPIANIAAPLLARSLVLPMTVARVSREDFSGESGDTVQVRVPQPKASREQAPGGGSLTADATIEVSTGVQVRHLYSLENLDEYQLNLQAQPFAQRVTALQIEAVARGAENKIATVINNLTADIEFALTATAADTKATVIAAREALSEADCPAEGRFLACSPSIISRLLNVDEFVRADASGSDSALRNAVVGRIYGLTVVESNGLTEDEAVAYHRSGFVFANFAPANPQGAISSAQATSQDIALRSLFQYNPASAVEQALVSTFAGAAAVLDGPDESTTPRYVKLAVGTT